MWGVLDHSWQCSGAPILVSVFRGHFFLCSGDHIDAGDHYVSGGCKGRFTFIFLVLGPHLRAYFWLCA